MGKLDTFSMAAFCPPTDGSDGYIASKWMAEQILEHFAKSEGIPVHIHRPTSITGDGTTDTDLMANILHYSRLMQAVPEFPDATGVCDLVPVEEVAEGILTQALGLGSDQVERLRGADRADVAVKASQIHLHSGKTQIPVDALDSYVKEVGGLQHLPQKVHLSDWITQAVERGLTESVASLLSTPEAARGHGMTIPRLHK
ncbi:unnamed protein product [Periconia digitata]|uniref:Thioester reductase (TE) domain-containing protein n=1 Tax=Periconia digitata TaxID=1303443 RepID=A0A9W4U3P5_9PLEO|nr:unnamed protein product [Periconia digitata]